MASRKQSSSRQRMLLRYLISCECISLFVIDRSEISCLDLQDEIFNMELKRLERQIDSKLSKSELL